MVDSRVRRTINITRIFKNVLYGIQVISKKQQIYFIMIYDSQHSRCFPLNVQDIISYLWHFRIHRLLLSLCLVKQVP